MEPQRSIRKPPIELLFQPECSNFDAVSSFEKILLLCLHLCVSRLNHFHSANEFSLFLWCTLNLLTEN
jgi:hypothetical protein